jgi:hypothetical protein
MRVTWRLIAIAIVLFAAVSIVRVLIASVGTGVPWP